MEWNDSSQATRFIYKLNPPALPGKRWSSRAPIYADELFLCLLKFHGSCALNLAHELVDVSEKISFKGFVQIYKVHTSLLCLKLSATFDKHFWNTQQYQE
jgi:hypothetical protein